MRIVIRTRQLDHVVAVAGTVDDSVTLGDLLAPVAELLIGSRGTVPHHILVDGRSTPTDTTLAEAALVDGSIVSTEAGSQPARSAPTQPSIEIVGGLASGVRAAVPLRRMVIGRSCEADIVVSAASVDPYHLAIDPRREGLMATDLDSVNGTVVDGQWLLEPTAVVPGAIIDLGAAQLTLRTAADDRPDELFTLRGRTAPGTLPFNRPPRETTEAPTAAVSLPSVDASTGLSSFFSWAGLLAPLAMGGLMAWLYDPRWALFALLGPVMMVGGWLESRRRSSQASRRRRHHLDRALEGLRSELVERSRAELRHRRSRNPDLAELVRRVEQPSIRLWQRRLHHEDAMEMVVGTVDQRWALEPACDGRPDPRALELVASFGRLDDAPLVTSLRPGHVIGLSGPRSAAVAVARSLVLQAAIHHGPADVEISVLVTDAHAADWRWTEWLPHSRSRVSRGRDRAVAIGPAAISKLVAGLVAVASDRGESGRSPAPSRSAPAGAMLLCVVDGDGLTTGRAAPARALLGGRAGAAGGIVIASSHDRLPHCCTTVIEVTDADGLGRVALPGSAVVHDAVLLGGTTHELTTETARRLARFADPEVDLTEATIPLQVSLLELLSMPDVDPSSIMARWSTTAGMAGLCAAIGADGMGPLVIDLVRDGPHALVGGTTGAGKSELLRTLVAALAASHDVDHLNVVLIDYKGGSAFDSCAMLPHTVGLVTDLDEHLGARALTCLEAELRHRERVLRSAGSTDIAEYRTLSREPGATEPLPRLVVVIDEFATMAAELPDFLDALVGIAQRGRSLGVHLVLATQRPAGAVSPSIRTNTSLRIALRVLDAGDSVDVIDTTDAVTIGRDQPGRAYIRLGPGEAVPFQSARVTGHTDPDRHRPAHVVLDRRTEAQGLSRSGDVDGSPDDLERLVAAIGEAHRELGLGDARCPWPDPLPARIPLDALPDADTPMDGATVRLGLADDPERQRQTTACWNLDHGNAVLVGMTGAGTTTALTTIAVSLATQWSPDRMHIYGIDLGAAGLRPLEALPHVGAVIDASGLDRQLRLVKRLDSERRRRSAMSAEALCDAPRLVVLIDGYGSWRDDLDSANQSTAVDAFARVYADGPPLGINCAIAGDHPGVITRQLAAVTSQLFLFRLADPVDYLTAGLRDTSTDRMPPGRAFLAGDGREMQFAVPHADGLDVAMHAVLARHGRVGTEAPAIGRLPIEITAEQLGARARLGGDVSWIPVGIGDDELTPVGFELYPGEHALVAGRARTGKSSTLCAIAQLLSGTDAQVIALASTRSPLLAEPAVDLATTTVTEAAAAVTARRAKPTVLLVDDADLVSDVHGALERILGRGPSEELGVFHAIVAGRTDRLLASYGHWSSIVRSSRNGVMLCPELLDGDLFGLQLPSRVELPALPGRGWFVSVGSRQVCQLASPDHPASSNANARSRPGSPSAAAIATDNEADQRSRRTRSA